MKSIATVACLGAFLMTSQVTAAELTIDMEGIRNDQGSIWITLHDDASSFLQDSYEKASILVKLPANEGKVSVTLAGIPDGSYAGSIVHDENGDGKMTMDGVTPKEGYAYTNNVGREAIPSFPEAELHVTGVTRNTVEMIYY